jgi:hypothetical protein
VLGELNLVDIDYGFLIVFLLNIVTIRVMRHAVALVEWLHRPSWKLRGNVTLR